MLGIASWLSNWLNDGASSLPTVTASGLPRLGVTTSQANPFGMPVWNEGLQVYDEFEVERQLGTGSLGPVYLIRNRSDDRRYVVKRVRFRDESTRTAFLSDIEKWVYLPENPYLGACRFVRTCGLEADIFAEPLDGVCLKDAITTRKLYEGSAEATIERILDIAIQMAWGLQTLEDLKLLHGNLKPTDVFVSSKGIARITSMGLAHATAHAFRADGAAVTGPSPVYASPEVGDGGQITRTSDLWCWALIVLEMFAGAVTWGEAPPEPKEIEEPEENAKLSLNELRAIGQTPQWGGRTGLHALEEYLKCETPEKPLPVMPASVAAVLRRCFAPRIQDRWSSAIEIAQALRTAHREQLRREHPRHVPTAVHHSNQLIVAHARWSRASGAQWLTIHEWEERIQRAMGEPTQASQRRASSLGLKAQAEHDHSAIFALQTRCGKLIADGHSELRHEQAGLYIDHGFLHVGMQNIPKAVECFDQALAIWEELVTKEGREDLKHDLAMARLNRGIAMKQQGRLEEALADYEKAIELWKNQVGQEGRRELSATLGWAEASRAKVLFKLAIRERTHALGLNRAAQELRAQTQEQSAETRALRSRLTTLHAKIETLQSGESPAPAKDKAQSQPTAGQSAAKDVEREIALQAARTELMKTEEALQVAEELEAKAKAKQQEARSVDAGAKTLQKRAETEARAALSVLQAEVKRTDRDDARAVLHWAQRAFEGLL